MSFLTLDIETVPMWRFTEPDVPVDEKWCKEMLEKESEGTDPGFEFSDERARELVADYLKRGEAKLACTGMPAALHPSTSHVISVSWGPSDGETSVRQWDDEDRLDGEDEDFECTLVSHTFRAIDKAIQSGRTIVTFSGTSFDLPTLRWRAAILGLEIPKIKWDGPPYHGSPAGLLYPFDTDTHCDLRLVWTNGKKFAKGTLADMSAAFDIKSVEHGGDVYEWFRANDWDSPRAYGHDEARNLIELYRACERIL